MKLVEFVFKSSRAVFIVVGGITVLIATGLFFSLLGGGTQKNNAPSKLIRSVFARCGLDSENAGNVLTSYVSAYHFTGDYLTAYEVEIKNITLKDLTNGSRAELWYRADNLPPIVDKAVSFVCGLDSEIPWFPSKQNLLETDVFVYVLNLRGIKDHLDEVDLVFVNTSKKILYYISLST